MYTNENAVAQQALQMLCTVLSKPHVKQKKSTLACQAIASCDLCIWLSNNQWNLKEVGMKVHTMNQLQITDASVQMPVI